MKRIISFIVLIITSINVVNANNDSLIINNDSIFIENCTGIKDCFTDEIKSNTISKVLKVKKNATLVHGF